MGLNHPIQGTKHFFKIRLTNLNTVGLENFQKIIFKIQKTTPSRAFGVNYAFDTLDSVQTQIYYNFQIQFNF